MTERLARSELALVRAIPEQWRKIQEFHAFLWGGGVSIADYQDRKTLLCIESEFSKRGNFTGWALVPKDDPKSLTKLLSFCDTYERPIYVKDDEHPEGHENKCTCVASVFTPVEHRGKGYARLMLTLLHDEMAKTSVMSILYSDIGDYYSTVVREHVDDAKRIGWEIVKPFHVVWDVTAEQATPDDTMSSFKRLEEEDIQTVCEYDAELLKTEVPSKPNAAFAVLPSGDQIDWQLRRTRFFDNLRHPKSRYDYPKVDNWGCQHGQPGDEDFAFAIWHYDVNLHELNILRLRCTSTAQLRTIVHMAKQAALAQGMKVVTAWNVEEALLEGTDWKNVERKEHLPAVAWYGNGNLPGWICNENWVRC